MTIIRDCIFEVALSGEVSGRNEEDLGAVTQVASLFQLKRFIQFNGKKKFVFSLKLPDIMFSYEIIITS